MEKIIENFKTSGGKHCITTALKQVFEYYNFEISEEMIFGIGCGLDFVYINLANSPMISGRSKPFVFEKRISKRLNIDIKCKSSIKYENAFDRTKKMINKNKPVLAYVDMAYLKYLNLDEDNHFGGHAVVIFGYNDEKEEFYISDRDNCDNKVRTPRGEINEDYHLVDYKEAEMARNSNYTPFPAKNKYLDINNIDSYIEITPHIIKSSIKETCNNMLNSSANLLGLNGINKFSKEILKWSKFDEEKLKRAGVTNYFLINADGGTGGGIFRNMYGQFLIQASKIVKSEEMNNLGLQYIKISQKWDKVGGLMWQLYESGNENLLKEMSDIIKEIHKEETVVLSKLQQIIT